MMIQKILCAVACATGLALGASAGIPEFNDAMRRGDIQAASVEAVDTWESWDKTHPDTALMAREFGFVSMLAGNYEAARDFARFLADQGAHLPKPDDFPLTSAVLLWAAEYKLSGSAEMRDALAVSLRQRAEIEGVDLITAAGAEALYSGDWVTGDWERVIESAGLAVELMGRDPDGLIPRMRRAQMIGAAADFLYKKDRLTKSRNETYHAMADVHDAIAADIDADTEGRMRSQLWPLKWQAEAWAHSMEAYLTSDYAQIDSLISTKVEARRLVHPNVPYVETSPELAAFPVCPGEFKGKRMTYPSSRAFSGLVGSVLVRIETDERGKVINTELLASVPLEGFAETVLEKARTWTYRPDRDADLRQCRVEFNNYTYKVSFLIG